MKFKSFISLFFFIFILNCSQDTTQQTATSPMIRVALSQIKLPCNIKIAGEYHLKSGAKTFYHGTQLSVNLRIEQNNIYLGELSCGSNLSIVAGQNIPIALGNRVYFGEINIVIHSSNKYLLTNILPCEDYIAVVISPLLTEQTPSPVAECYAVMARTYMLYSKTNAISSEFDISDTLESQPYFGIMPTESAKNATIATNGLVMLYQDSLFRPFYHQTCGGATTSAHTVFSYPDIAPLSGIVCPYCYSQTNQQTWQYIINLNDLQRLCLALKVAVPQEIAQNQLNISIALQDKYQRVFSIQCTCGNKSKIITVPQLCHQLPENAVKSNCFQIYYHENAWHIIGRGQGHGVGLCLTGACLAAETHSSYEILRLYYPGINLYRLWTNS